MDRPIFAPLTQSPPQNRELASELKNYYHHHGHPQYTAMTRISDKTAFFLLGKMIEFDSTEQLFSMPKDKRTEDYITGRFG